MLSFIQQKINARFYAGDKARMIAQGEIPDPQMSLKRLKGLGFNPGVIYDVGAYQGDFTKMCLNLWPTSEVHVFEGLPGKMPILRTNLAGRNVKITNVLIGQENSQNVTFYGDETASSILESHALHPKDKIELQMITLDSYVQQGNHVPQFLKIDTQGYEYQILKGFEKHLGSVEVLLLELNFMEIYYHVILAQDVIGYLSNFNFVIYDVCEFHRRPLDQALTQMDFLFVKEDSVYRKDKRWDR